MRVLLTGATGLIGRAVLAGLYGEGHAVVAVARSAAARLPEAVSCVTLDIAEAANPADWLPHLAGIDAVVNCAGVLQDSPRDSTAGVHTDGVAALFAACEQAGVRRVVQISAIGVDRGAATAFARTKLAGDQALMTCNLEWVILRPSVVVGRQAYGGSALFRGLAALPIMPRVAGTGPLQVLQLDDLVRTVLFFLKPDAPIRIALEIAGPERLSLDEVLIAYRRWLGHGDARFVTVPRWLGHTAFRLGDAIGLLGWRPPLRSTARLELMRGGVGDPTPWTRLTGIEPRALRAALAAEPASVQERWFARLYFAKPLDSGSADTLLDRDGPGSTGTRLGGRHGAHPGSGLRHGRPTGGRKRHRRHCYWRRHRRQAHREARALGCPGPVDRLRGARHAAAARALGRPARASAEGLADHGAQPGGAGNPGRPLMTAYLALKYLHVIGAAVLLGTGAGIAFFMLLAHRTREARTVAAVARIVVTADFVFTATAVVAQPITGVLLAWAIGHSLRDGWIVLSILLYLLTGAFWLPVVWMQMRMRDLAAAAARQGVPLPAEYHRLFRLWFAFGFPAFAAVLAIFWLMIARPRLW